MSEKPERSKWAWERIEAFADDSLDASDRARMHEALRADPSLRAAVERARAVRSTLGDLRRAPVPAGLLGRLLAAPFPERRRRNWLLIGAPAAVAAIAIGVAVYVTRPPPRPNEAELAAMRELALAMRYLQQSAVTTEEEVGGAVTAGLLDAFRAGNVAVRDETPEDEDGG
jgi:ferric-dicitrate binding protein FerR (iron transport regulator)